MPYIHKYIEITDFDEGAQFCVQQKQTLFIVAFVKQIHVHFSIR